MRGFKIIVSKYNFFKQVLLKRWTFNYFTVLEFSSIKKNTHHARQSYVKQTLQKIDSIILQGITSAKQ